MDWIKKAGLYALGALASILILGSMTGMAISGVTEMLAGNGFRIALNASVLLSPITYLTGLVETVLIALLFLVFGGSTARASKRMLKGKAKRIEGALENSRFMNDKEKNELFPHKLFTKLKEEKKDGIPM